GIRYADLSEAERERWDELEWQDGEIPDAIDAAAMNRWLFNADTVDKVLDVLVTEGRRWNGCSVASTPSTDPRATICSPTD
ncbi:MAG: hypothetical protein J0H70_01970, partial [Microbacterium chocolatum]|nr:hypothetical protein [Microbacterium chocolatum]